MIRDNVTPCPVLKKAKKARFSKIEAAEVLLSFHNIQPDQMDAAETLLALSQTDFSNQKQSLSNSNEHIDESIEYDNIIDHNINPLLESKENINAAVQTTITMENIRRYPDKCLLSHSELKKLIFLEKVSSDSVHYTGNHECIFSNMLQVQNIYNSYF